MTEQAILVLAEKPDAARKIAQALSPDGIMHQGSHYTYDIPKAFDGKHYTVCSAVGHLYELFDPNQQREIFPVLDVDWYPRTTGSRRLKRGRRPFDIDLLVKLKIADIARLLSLSPMSVNACDFDFEGETIGFNALGFGAATPSPLILRARFSTLAPADIRRSFSQMTVSDPKLATTGRMRHVLDFLWGVNLSRALTVANRFEKEKRARNLTIGRVQGPTLAFVVERELERKTHVPVPSWRVTCELIKQVHAFSANYIDSPIRRYSTATGVQNAASEAEEATVSKVIKTRLSIPPRYPYNLGDLQKEAFRIYKLPPQTTLSIIQKLYQEALISYPRTDSQRLPEGLGVENILGKLSGIGHYAALYDKLQSDPKKRLLPVQGPKDDPAHPAIHPTGEQPKAPLSRFEERIFDLVVRRFFNTLAPNEIAEKIRVMFDVATLTFYIDGVNILDEGWTFYYPFGKILGNSLEASFEEGEKVRVLSALLKEEYEPMPDRFTEGTLLFHMEKVGIGTKATRAETIATLIDRDYAEKEQLELLPTFLGASLVEKISRVSPEITSSQMTKELEEQLDRLRNGKVSDVDFVVEMLSSLRPVMKQMLHRNLAIGVASPNLRESNQEKMILGQCPICNSGTLDLFRSKRTGKRSIRCSNFGRVCKASSPALPRGKILPSNAVCSRCGWPMISISPGNRSRTCSNFYCPSKMRRT
jgi:DNA topoisomerase I